MELGIAGRRALLAGSTDGLGLAIAESLSREGVRVAVSGRRGRVARELASSLPTEAIGLRMDITDRDSINEAVKAVQEAFGGIDILVLNSGGPPPIAATELSEGLLQHALRLLLLGHLHLVSLTLPQMQRQAWGRVVAVGSSAMQEPIPEMAPSNVVRAAVGSYIKTLAGEVGRFGITASVVLPGRIDTARVAHLDQVAAQKMRCSAALARKRSMQNIPLARYGTPEEFADVVTFLCSERASYVTGAQIRVDGGLLRSL